MASDTQVKDESKSRKDSDDADEKKRRKSGQAKPDDNDQDDDGDDDKKSKPPMPRWKKLLYWAIGIAVVVVLIIGAVIYYLYSRQFETTDDAFIDGYLSRVSAQASGRVSKLLVIDNQQVQAGQALLEIDPKDYQARLNQALATEAQARASVLQAQAQVALQQATIGEQQANLVVAQANLSQAQQDLRRFRSVDPRAIAQQQVTNQGQQTKGAQARVDAAKQTVDAAVAQRDAAIAQVTAAEAQLRQASAQAAQAQINLGYTTVYASQDGRVTQRTVDVGNYVSPGQALMAVVPSEVWITANFKETQLNLMRVGQPVAISLDAYPGAKLTGHVNSFSRATGTVFSTLPAENATGNYVKVVQRVPVKITFDGTPWTQYPLAPGMSVEPRVTVR